MKRIITEIILVPVCFLIGIAFAWVPMLAWNHGLHVIFPNLPLIGYWTAFWISVGLSYLKTTVVPIKDN